MTASTLPGSLKEHHTHLLPTVHLDAKGKVTSDVPLWVVISCALAMCLGTMAGGKKIIKTMGTKIIKISPLQGFAAQTSGTGTIIAASVMGIPVSTTHCITASVMGAGVSKGALGHGDQHSHRLGADAAGKCRSGVDLVRDPHVCFSASRELKIV